MIRTFPEPGKGRGSVRFSVGPYAPVPFAFRADEVGADVLPCRQGPFQAFFKAQVFPRPEIADDGLRLHPPLAGIVPGTVGEGFVGHGAVREQAFVAGIGHPSGALADAFHQGVIPQRQGTFLQQPGGLYVVPVGDGAGKDAPICPEIEPQMPVRPHDPVPDQVDEFPRPLFQQGVRPGLVEVGVGLQEVQVRVHGLVCVDVVGAQGTVRERGEVPGQSFCVTAVLPVMEIPLCSMEQADGRFQRRLVSIGQEKLA